MMPPEFSRDDAVQMLHALATGATPCANVPFAYARSHIRSHVFFAQFDDQVRLNLMLSTYFFRQPDSPACVEEYMDGEMDMVVGAPRPPVQTANTCTLLVAAATAAASNESASVVASATASKGGASASAVGSVGCASPIGSARPLVHVDVPDAVTARAAAPSGDPCALTSLADSNSPKRKRRRCDGPGLGHVGFESLKDVRALWDEARTLHRRDRENPTWRQANKASRDLYNDKLFFYREIAWQVQLQGGIDAALDAVQARLNGFQTKRTPGWTKLLRALQTEQTQGSAKKKRASELLDSLKGT